MLLSTKYKVFKMMYNLYHFRRYHQWKQWTSSWRWSRKKFQAGINNAMCSILFSYKGIGQSDNRFYEFRHWRDRVTSFKNNSIQPSWYPGKFHLQMRTYHPSIDNIHLIIIRWHIKYPKNPEKSFLHPKFIGAHDRD